MEEVICSLFLEEGLLKIIYKAQLVKWLLVCFCVGERAWLLLPSDQDLELPVADGIGGGWQGAVEGALSWRGCCLAPLL